MTATGIRQSRRLAALTECDSTDPPHGTTQAAQSHGPQAAATEATAAAAGLQDAQQAQHGASAQSWSHSSSLLQRSTLEASANVLKGLVILAATSLQ